MESQGCKQQGYYKLKLHNAPRRSTKSSIKLNNCQFYVKGIVENCISKLQLHK